MDESKLPTTPIGKLIHVTEECAEVQKAISKLIRFGPKAYHPEDPQKVPNSTRLLDEIDDLELALDEIDDLELALDRLKELIHRGEF